MAEEVRTRRTTDKSIPLRMSMTRESLMLLVEKMLKEITCKHGREITQLLRDSLSSTPNIRVRILLSITWASELTNHSTSNPDFHTEESSDVKAQAMSS
jgi:hypothetical protein